jgi:hypothetical protein
MLIHEYSTAVPAGERLFRARALARQEPEGTWVGWLEFEPTDAPLDAIATGQETSQPNLTAIEYWAGGLEPVYLEGALERARRLAEQARSGGA